MKKQSKKTRPFDFPFLKDIDKNKRDLDATIIIKERIASDILEEVFQLEFVFDEIFKEENLELLRQYRESRKSSDLFKLGEVIKKSVRTLRNYHLPVSNH